MPTNGAERLSSPICRGLSSIQYAARTERSFERRRPVAVKSGAEKQAADFNFPIVLNTIGLLGRWKIEDDRAWCFGAARTVGAYRIPVPPTRIAEINIDAHIFNAEFIDDV